jgi:hypothetical protein
MTVILQTGDTTRYWLMEDLLGLAKGLASEIAKEHEISAVAGVPRSGMLAASAMAIHLSVPLLEASSQGLRSLTHGRRIENVPQKGRTIVVEDSLNTGRRFSELKRSLGEDHLYASIFSTPRSKRLADYVACELPLPHWFDWWLYGSRAMQQMRIGIDFDGILCGDFRLDAKRPRNSSRFPARRSADYHRTTGEVPIANGKLAFAESADCQQNHLWTLAGHCSSPRTIDRSVQSSKNRGRAVLALHRKRSKAS